MPLSYFSWITKASVYGKPRGKCEGAGENIFYNSSKCMEKQLRTKLTLSYLSTRAINSLHQRTKTTISNRKLTKDTQGVNLSGKVNTPALQERTCMSTHAKVKKDLWSSKASADHKKQRPFTVLYLIYLIYGLHTKRPLSLCFITGHQSHTGYIWPLKVKKEFTHQSLNKTQIPNKTPIPLKKLRVSKN